MPNNDLILRAELAATLGELTFGGGDLLHTDDVMDAIKAAPAVDAIPLEWLKTQLIDEFYDELIFRWQKEQEER